jgi:hypothetical protein
MRRPEHSDGEYFRLSLVGGARQMDGPRLSVATKVKVSAEMARTQRLAKLLLEVLEEHARDALEQEVPRDIYVRAVADHAAHVYDTQKNGAD